MERRNKKGQIFSDEIKELIYECIGATIFFGIPAWMIFQELWKELKLYQ